MTTSLRRLIPFHQRQLISSALRRCMGSQWKSLAFRSIDRTPLTALRANRAFEPELKLLPLFLPKPGVVFDVGANKGDYTYVLEKTVGSEFTYAVEPLPHLCADLHRLFPRAHVLNMGLSDTCGTLTLKTPIIDGMPFWTRSTLERFVDQGETNAIFEQVPVTTLDLFCEQSHLPRVRLIKIDVEGHERHVLAGAANILRTSRPALLVEIEQRHHTEPIADLFHWIQQQGYLGAFFDIRAMALRSLSQFSVDVHQRLSNLGGPNYVNNFFFIDSVSAKSTFEVVQCLLTNPAAVRSNFLEPPHA